MKIRTGIGYDIHKLKPNIPLWIGGINIPFAKGLAGHSDGDVLIHAIVDAILGAAGLGDIGQFFPSSDPRFKDIASTKFLKETSKIIREHLWCLSNLDATIICEQPRLTDSAPGMVRAIANNLGVDKSLINVKSTTADKLGHIGQGDAIAALAIATLEERK